MKHEIKIKHKYLIQILGHQKCFEVRYNDRDYQVGDTIKFSPLYDPAEKENAYDVRHIIPEYFITYVHGGLGMAENYVVLGIKELVPAP